MESKECSGCNLIKPINDFTLDKKGKFGRSSKCKLCRCILDKEYRKNNKEKNTKRMREWRKNNPEKAKESYLNHRKINLVKLRKDALDKQKKYRKDPMYKFKEAIRNRIRNSINHNGSRKNSKTSQILGCSFEEFRCYIESKFEPWMNWENRGLYNGKLNHGWDIDHITPMSSATCEEDVVSLNHYTNLQPLCSKINRDIKRGIH